MTEAPERIWTSRSGLTIVTELNRWPDDAEYVRADFYAAALARVAALEAQNAELIRLAAGADGWKARAASSEMTLVKLARALRRITEPAPGVSEPAPPWVVGIARAALKGKP